MKEITDYPQTSKVVFKRCSVERWYYVKAGNLECLYKSDKRAGSEKNRADARTALWRRYGRLSNGYDVDIIRLATPWDEANVSL